MSIDQTLQGFLEDLASDAPAPGGGSASAAVGAMGAALVSMVCNLTIGKQKFAAVEEQMKEILARSEKLRARLTEMMEEDVTAFNTVMSAYRLPKNTPAEKATRSTAIQDGTKSATLTPLTTARLCGEVIELAKPAAEMGNPNVASDAGVAVLCAQAGLKGAALNVLINLAMIKDQTFRSEVQTELDEILAAPEALADEIYELVKVRL